MGEDDEDIKPDWGEDWFTPHLFSPGTTYVPYIVGRDVEHSLQFLEPKDINNPKAMFDKINEIIDYIRRSR